MNVYLLANSRHHLNGAIGFCPCRFPQPPAPFTYLTGCPSWEVRVHGESAAAESPTTTQHESVSSVASLSYAHTSPTAGLLAHHPDQNFARFVLQGLSFRFHINFSSTTWNLRPMSSNHPSSTANRQIVLDYIESERAAGRVLGPLCVPVCQFVHCSPIGLVSKGRNSGCWRMIADLFHPSNWSVNDGIPKSLCSLKYPSVDDALHYVRSFGPGTLLLKVNLKSSYGIVPVHPLDCHLLGLCLEDRIYVDQALPFGLRLAPTIVHGTG